MSNTGCTRAAYPALDVEKTSTRDGPRAAGSPPCPILTVVVGDKVVEVDANAPPEERRQQRVEALSLIAKAISARVTATAQARDGEPS
jgi:hypothetical protein